MSKVTAALSIKVTFCDELITCIANTFTLHDIHLRIFLY